jgi:hypothetical protein
MRRLNVRFSQLTECIEKSLFAVETLPRTPPLRSGELLLLQLVKEDAVRLGKLAARVEFALVFDRAEADPDGVLSRTHWPDAGKVWRYILVCSESVPAVPFSLEKLGLREDYSGQRQCVSIGLDDELIVREYFHPRVDALVTIRGILNPQLLQAIRNYDMVLRLSPARSTKVAEHARRLNDPWPTNALRAFYKHRCQVCANDFLPRYGVAHADIRFIIPIENGGSLESRNRLVVCPNHNDVITATRAAFNRNLLALEYPNGLRETLQLPEHLID